MSSSAGSAPAATSRTELPALHTLSPPPTSKSHDASPAPIRVASATDLCQTSPSTGHRGRARHRSTSRPRVTGTMDLKQLTCYWWRKTGECRFLSKDCLYAHHDTGRYAEAPRQVMPGQPAVAGRNADRKFREVENQFIGLHLEDARILHSRSSSSLTDVANHHHFPGITSGAFSISRPSTPGGLMLRSPGPGLGGFPILPNSPLHYATSSAAQLESEVNFLRTLVTQGGKEKEVMVSTIESLQAENQSLRAESESLKVDNGRLSGERDALRGTVSLLQRTQQQRSSSFPDFGAIGAKRLGSGSGGVP